MSGGKGHMPRTGGNVDATGQGFGLNYLGLESREEVFRV